MTPPPHEGYQDRVSQEVVSEPVQVSMRDLFFVRFTLFSPCNTLKPMTLHCVSLLGIAAFLEKACKKPNKHGCFMRSREFYKPRKTPGPPVVTAAQPAPGHAKFCRFFARCTGAGDSQQRSPFIHHAPSVGALKTKYEKTTHHPEIARTDC
jgi:hypothetical protein